MIDTPPVSEPEGGSQRGVPLKTMPNKYESINPSQKIGIDTPELHESQKLERDAHRSNQDKTTIQKLGQRAYEFIVKMAVVKFLWKDKYKR